MKKKIKVKIINLIYQNKSSSRNKRAYLIFIPLKNLQVRNNFYQNKLKNYKNKKNNYLHKEY